MYLAKAKRNVELQELKENLERKERNILEGHRHSVIGELIPTGQSEQSADEPENLDGSFKPDELPDGFCISPHRVVRSPSNKEQSAVRTAEYIGSFSVIGEDQSARAEYVRDQLTGMREVTKSKQVLLVISLSGIKVCSSSGQSVYMAHALKRISYATCDPEYCQFSFLAREPKGQTNMQYCHAFVTKSSQEAEELNTIVGNAFKMAYASQAGKHPTFNELIEQQLEAHKAKIQEVQEQREQLLQKRLTQISTATVAERVKERKEMRKMQQEMIEADREASRAAGKDKLWAKQAVPNTKHKSGYGDQRDEPGSPARHSGDLRYHRSYQNHVTAIKEAVDSGNIRSYGSPVMSLKETIDEHFKQQNGQATYDYRKSAPEEYYRVTSESRQTPLSQRSPHSQHSAKTQEIQSRPLPTTPGTSHVNGSPSSRKSQPSPPRDPRSERVVQRSPPGGSPLHRPSSAKSQRSEARDQVQMRSDMLDKGSQERYQNSSPIHQSPVHQSPVHQSPVQQSPVHQREPLDSRDGESADNYEGGSLRCESMRSLDNSDIEDAELRHASWYQPGIPREIALEILSQEEIGSFVVRDSTTHPGCYALSVKVPKYDNPSGISHYLILRTQRGGVKLKGLDKEWPSLLALVTHHTVMHEMLPCTLRLPRNAKNPIYKDSERNDREEDEDYQKLTDCSQMMQELKMT